MATFNIVFILIIISCKANSQESYKNDYDISTSSPVVVPLFIFGDSFLDAGNNNYINTTTLDQANFWPYGETYFNFSTGRFSDGRLISDFIAMYANLPLIPPIMEPGNHNYYYGANFASAGAGALVETFKGSVITLKTQVKNYKIAKRLLSNNLGRHEAKKIVSRGVYMFSIGSNDYTSPFFTNSTIQYSKPKSHYVATVIGNLTTVIQEIYKLGGRKFVFMNLGDLGCFPAMRITKPGNIDGSCYEQVTEFAKLHNKALSRLLHELHHQLNGFKYSIFDFNRRLRSLMDQPSKYGLKEGKEACCGTGKFRGIMSCGGKRITKKFELCKNPDEYVFWDSFHFTEKVNSRFADAMWNDSHVIGPYSVKKLFAIL